MNAYWLAERVALMPIGQLPSHERLSVDCMSSMNPYWSTALPCTAVGQLLKVIEESDREAVDGACRDMTASWVRKKAEAGWVR